jgi:hypothetical protein
MNARLFLLDMADVFRRRLGYLVGPWAGLFTLAIVIAFLLPAEFESSAVVLARATFRPSGAVSSLQFPDPYAVLREALFDSTTLRATRDDPAAAGRGVSLERGQEGSFVVRVIDSDPVRAQARAETLTRFAVRHAVAADSARIDEAIAAFEHEGGAPVLPPAPAVAAVPGTDAWQDLRSLRATLNRTSVALLAADDRLATVDRTDSAARSLLAGIDDPAIVAVMASGGTPPALPGRNDIHLAAERAASLLGRYTARHPEVQTARAALRAALTRGIAALTRLREDVDLERRQLTRQRDAVQARIAQAPPIGQPAGSTEPGVPPASAAPGELERLRIARDISVRSGPRFVILRPPTIPREPVRPWRAAIIGGGLAAGLLAGILVVVIVEAFDPTIRRTRDLEMFNKPVIATIP